MKAESSFELPVCPGTRALILDKLHSYLGGTCELPEIQGTPSLLLQGLGTDGILKNKAIKLNEKIMRVSVCFPSMCKFPLMN
jgi:hypothetical protein